MNEYYDWFSRNKSYKNKMLNQNRALRASSESRKIPFGSSRGTTEIVPEIFRHRINRIGTI